MLASPAGAAGSHQYFLPGELLLLTVCFHLPFSQTVLFSSTAKGMCIGRPSGPEGCGVSIHSGNLIVTLGAVLEVASVTTKIRKSLQLFQSEEESVS